jgi:dipeptidyl-peptidase 4
MRSGAELDLAEASRVPPRDPGVIKAVPSSPTVASSPLTPERVFGSPALSGPAARAVELSPDGRFVTFLAPEPNNQFKLDLWIAPAAGGEARLLVSGEAVEPSGRSLNEAEKGRRERMRLAAVSGVVNYHWDEQGKTLLIPAGGELYTADAETGEVAKLRTGGPGATDARISPMGRYASYVRDQNLYVIDLASGRERALTTEGRGTISFGVAEFIAQEEMGRYTGYWWAPGDDAIAYARIDESPVDIVPRLEIGAEGTKVSSQRYPRAGTANALVSLYVQRVTEDAMAVPVDLGAATDVYLARVHWSAGGRELYVERERRDQQRLDLLRVDPATGNSVVILSETRTPWVMLHHDFYSLKSGDFIWASERSGSNQLYLYHGDGTLVRPVTTGTAPVARGALGAGIEAPGVVGVDEEEGVLYFMASRATPVERQLYAVSYRAPAEPVAITQGHGWWTAVMPKSATVFVGYYSDPGTPPQTALYRPDGERLRWVEQNALDASHPFAPYAGRYPSPEFGTLKSSDGQDLHYVLQKPVNFDPSRRYPVIVAVYGGPVAQWVIRDWQDVREKLFLEAGFLLFQLDNRGSGNRDSVFEGAIAGRLGSVEVDDQVVGLDWLRSQPFVRADRIGVFGWSYGGYMVLRMLTDPRTHLTAGAAGAPVTDWRQYDSHYTERYMGDPSANAAGYDASAVIPRLGALSGRLLLVHGMADDNVPLANSIAVMAALQAQGTPFDLMLYPGERHGIQGVGRQLQLWKTLLGFFERELGSTVGG